MPTTLQVGDRAPAFRLMTQAGQSVALSDYHGKHVVLYFYPKDDTPGCTKEACSFQEHRVAVSRTGAVVLGVSGDDQASHARFAKKYDLTFPLLSDPGFEVSKQYGVYKKKSFYGRTYWGIERTTFLIGADGRISHLFSKVKVDGHTQEVLAALTPSRQRV